MKYANSSAFRRALEDRLRAQSLKTGAPFVRLRKMVAFDRLLARLIAAQADAWVLKGGLALQTTPWGSRSHYQRHRFARASRATEHSRNLDTCIGT